MRAGTRKRTRMRRRFALTGLGITGALYLLAGTSVDARAEVTNNGLACTATIQGFNVDSLDSEDTSKAVEVAKSSSVTVSMSSQQTMTSYTVDLAFGFRGWQVADGDSSQNSWSNVVKVNDYARFGIGLYRVVATSEGPSGTCTMAALVRVTGNPVPDTVAGDVGAALSALGVGGLAGGIGRALGGGSEGGDGGGDSGGGDSGGGGSPPTNEEVPTGLLPPDDDWCFPGFVMPMLLTLTFMIMGGGGGGVPASSGAGVATSPRLPRARWRLHIAGIPIISGILGALGVLVLFQQYGIMFPTLRVVIEALVAGVVVAIGLPSLVRIIPVRRWNRRMARREQLMANVARRAAQAGTPPPPAPPAAPTS